MFSSFSFRSACSSLNKCHSHQSKRGLFDNIVCVCVCVRTKSKKKKKTVQHYIERIIYREAFQQLTKTEKVKEVQWAKRMQKINCWEKYSKTSGSTREVFHCVEKGLSNRLYSKQVRDWMNEKIKTFRWIGKSRKSNGSYHTWGLVRIRTNFCLRKKKKSCNDNRNDWWQLSTWVPNMDMKNNGEIEIYWWVYFSYCSIAIRFIEQKSNIHKKKLHIWMLRIMQYIIFNTNV